MILLTIFILIGLACLLAVIGYVTGQDVQEFVGKGLIAIFAFAFVAFVGFVAWSVLA